MPERIHGGQALAVLGAVALVVSLFLNWFEPGRSAWTVFEVLDLVLAAIALATLAAAVPLIAGGRARRPLVAERWLPVLGIAALVIVAAALINHPPSAPGSSPEYGAWIALAAAIAMTVGAVLSTARVSLVITLRSTERAPRAPGGPAVAPEEVPPEPVHDPGVDPETETQPLSPRSRT